MSWTNAKNLKFQLEKLWQRGDLLRDMITGHQRFPLRLTLKGPASGDITDRFDAVRAWAGELAMARVYRLTFRDVRHRVQGVQRVPAGAWVDSIEDALTLLGKHKEWQRFAAMVAATEHFNPRLLALLARRPLQALEIAGDWDHLLAVVAWTMAHPRPGLYLRQVDLPGVRTKFIESNRAILAELLDLVLPAATIDHTKTGIKQFTGRYGFLDKPTRIRFRILDPGLHRFDGPAAPDIALDAASFSQLSLPVKRVFITENEINFLAFPELNEAIIIFGAGYGWDALAQSHWLHECALHYWGDIDTHGFAILNQLRGHFPHAHSLMMDRATLHAHSACWGVEDKPVVADLPRLTADEQLLFDDLRDDRIQAGLRLEQELIGIGWVNSQLGRFEKKGDAESIMT